MCCSTGKQIFLYLFFVLTESFYFSQRRPDATDRLLEYAQTHRKGPAAKEKVVDEWRNGK